MRKKIDERIRILIQNAIKARHRGIIMIVGDRAKDQVINLYNLWLSITRSENDNFQQPKILWCYKTELGFSSHQMKRKKEISKLMRQGLYEKESDSPFEVFLTSSDIRYCYYKETQKVLGSSNDILVLQDFEALTPNILCRTIETVKGGGLVFFMLKSMDTLKQMYTMSMDIHNRFRSDQFQDIEPLFNERMILSLVSSKAIVFVDDELNLLNVSSEMKTIVDYDEDSEVLKALKSAEKDLVSLVDSIRSNHLVHTLLKMTKTIDQAKVVLFMLDSLKNKGAKTDKSDMVFLSSGRGRGKSAALGISIAGALGLGNGTIYIAAATPENLTTVFQFIELALEELGYKKNLDFMVKLNKDNIPLSLTLFTPDDRLNESGKVQKQRVIYITPDTKVHDADLIVIDEAAAIPLNKVKPYIFDNNSTLFVSSTIHGYEGTGRSLSLKLIEEVRKQTQRGTGTRSLREVEMLIPIRYNTNDPIEEWLNSLLCLDATIPRQLKNAMPHPSECNLYFVNKSTLFSYNKSSEAFLKSIWSLFVSSHYKNSPNDLQLLSDAPAHFLAVLLGPIDKNSKKADLPDVLVAMQLCFEGGVRQHTIEQNKNRGIRPAGDLIPWALSEQFMNSDIFETFGVRVVRIAAHREATKLGYGSRALQLLTEFFENKFLAEKQIDLAQFLKISSKNDQFQELAPKKGLPPLLKPVNELNPNAISYLSVSYGLTTELFKFWSKNGFSPFYLKQAKNETTGEHNCMMIKPLDNSVINYSFIFEDFKRRFVKLLSADFRDLDLGVSIDIIKPNLNNRETPQEFVTENAKQFLELLFTPLDLKRLEGYCRNAVEHYMIKDLVSTIAELFFLNCFPEETKLSFSQAVILLAVGLQKRTVDELGEKLELNHSQILALYNKTIKRLFGFIKTSSEDKVERELEFDNNGDQPVMQPLKTDTDDLIGGLVKKNYPKEGDRTNKKLKSN